jgi:hypothetical protein
MTGSKEALNKFVREATFPQGLKPTLIMRHLRHD